MTKRMVYGMSCREIIISLASRRPKRNRNQLAFGDKGICVILRNIKRAFYTNLLTSCKLNSYLADIDEQAEEMFSRLVKQLAEKRKM